MPGRTDRIVLLKDQQLNGEPVVVYNGGYYLWTIFGTFGSATSSLQYLAADGSTWITIATTNANSSQLVAIGAGTRVRVSNSAFLTGFVSSTLDSCF